MAEPSLYVPAAGQPLVTTGLMIVKYPPPGAGAALVSVFEVELVSFARHAGSLAGIALRAAVKFPPVDRSVGRSPRTRSHADAPPVVHDHTVFPLDFEAVSVPEYGGTGQDGVPETSDESGLAPPASAPPVN